jgi:hypothetical protein
MEIEMRKILLALGASLSMGSMGVLAHGNDKPLYGGIVQTAADLQFELVVQPTGAALFIVDHGKPLDASKMAGKLTVLNGTEKSEAAFRHAGGNKLEVTGVKLDKGAKAVVSLTGVGSKPLTVRFSLK